MKVLFAAGDVGGARALAPVVRRAGTAGHTACVLRHGAILDSLDQSPVQWVDPTLDPRSYLADAGITHFAFASSMHDPVALDWARAAQDMSIPCLHLLDNWSNYAARLIPKTGPTCRPDIYAVMDDLAASEAIRDGIDPQSVLVTGTPALAHIEARATSPAGPIIFVSEPVSDDQGRSPDTAGFRGYTEDQVLDQVLHAHAQICPRRPFWVFAHPRETPERLRAVLARHGLDDSTQIGGLAPSAHGPEAAQRTALWHAAGAVIGMASILLYENWLAGRPSLSVQPDIRIPHLRYLQGRPGLGFCDTVPDIAAALAALLKDGADTALIQTHQARACQERMRHKGADLRVLRALSEFDPNRLRDRSAL